MKARIEDGVVYSPFPDVEIPCCSFYEAVKRALLVDADKPILADDSVTLTKKELLSQVRRYAAGFQRHGIRPGARVCVHVSNNIDSIVAMWGCVVAGASIVLAKPSLTETKGFVSTLTFLDIDETEFQETTVEDPRECVLCILYTSGTTGLPKGVELTHYALLASLGMSRYLSRIGSTIVDQMTERRLGPYQTGEIRYRAPNVMKSYYKRPKETEEFFDVEGWCKSGDAGYYDEEGRIHFVQRFKEMIKCMDNQVVPAALEETLLAEHYRVLQDVCVVGIPSPKYGEAPAAAVVPRNTDDKALVDLANRIKSTIVDSSGFVMPISRTPPSFLRSVEPA
ncbi:hypothetical protein HPB49_007820 [Dermacentor silvarum]|uniref:Uncharacterized protein n=1 Tax=Dermacentor silvarum TaxID=543639 RepID=A0ACB8CW50_DERSI|nr:hypothetical protein HPB49_007820 [Dermacentor silvarum]